MARVGWRIARKALLLCCLLTATGAGDPQPGKVLDEARQAGRSAASLPAPMEDYFHDMDGGAELKPDPATKLDPVLGRNTWLVWTGGNDRFWDKMTDYTFGAFDLLKIVAYDPNKPIDHADRWKSLGLINEPCMQAPTAPDPDRFGLLLDVRKPGCPADPFEDATKYPGVKIGARGSTVPVGSLLRLCQRHHRAAAVPQSRLRRSGQGEVGRGRLLQGRLRQELVRPYRVGMSCGFCHVGPSPVHPPADPANPQFADLSSTVGAQYMWVDRLFIYRRNPDNYFFQLVHTYRPGAMDTSLVSTDNINNPRTMNAIYSLGDRLAAGAALGTRDAGGRTAQQQAVQQLPEQRSADAVLSETQHLLDAARAEGRFGFGRRAGRAQPRLSEHRPVQRGMAAALQSRDRRQADHADPDRDRRRRTPATGRRPRPGRRTPPGSFSRQRSLTG